MTIRLDRRVVVGTDSQGRSTVVADGRDMASALPGTGVRIEEVWWQDQVPARTDQQGARTGDIGLEAPAGGAVVRVLTVPPVPAETWSEDLHFDDSMHVMTMVEGELGVVLEVGEVVLQRGDSIVLPGSVHDLRNTSGAPSVFVYTSFPLTR